MKNIWKIAAKENLLIDGEFKTVSFVALWGLPFDSKIGESLNSIYRKFKKELQEDGELSLVASRKFKNNDAELIVELVEDVYTTRKDEAAETSKKAKLKEKLALLENLKTEKELEELKGKDTKSLEEEIAELRKELQK